MHAGAVRGVAPSSFTSLASSISCTSLLLLLPLALTSCSRTVATEPGVVNFLIESMPTNLDPRIGTDAVSQRLDSLIFSSLVELDAQRIPRGDLAERWDTPDAITYVFHLRSGVKFHDGRPLTSADVKYTFDSILDRTVTSPKRGSLAMIRSIDAPDAATVIFHLQEPYAGFLWAIARPTVGIVPAGSGADFSERLTGTGPFRFVSANQDDNIVIERNGEYFGGAPNISRVRFRVVPEAIVRALELRKGSADVEVNSLAFGHDSRPAPAIHDRCDGITRNQLSIHCIQSRRCGAGQTRGAAGAGVCDEPRRNHSIFVPRPGASSRRPAAEKQLGVRAWHPALRI